MNQLYLTRRNYNRKLKKNFHVECTLESANEWIETKPCIVHGNVQDDAPIIILLSEHQSPLYRKFLQYLSSQDLVLVFCSSERSLAQWLIQNPSLNISNLVLQSNCCERQFIYDCHSLTNIESILIYCNVNELSDLEQYTRRLPKVEGIYSDDMRLLMKLVMNQIFLAERSGDEHRYENKNELKAQRNYDRAIRLCELVEDI